MKRLIIGIIIALAVLTLLGGATGWYLGRDERQKTFFRTARLTRGNLLVSIDASGTIEPEEVIDVGAQIAGQIRSLGKDTKGKTVDYGSIVDEGVVLALIDDSVYQAEVVEATAQLKQTEAVVKGAEAELLQLKARFNQAKRDWERAQKIGPSEALAQCTYDSYRASYEIAEANVAVGEAAIMKAQASVIQAQAGLERAQRNLGYCTIKSPVRGVIIDRRVSIGQTVVAGMNAPSLFLIARDLKRMKVWVAVNEADIARIYPGQSVTFTADALPDETFRGEVDKVRLNASMTQNIVTYTVEISTDNSSGCLLPYLTANVRFEVSRRDNVLLVPTTALRWMPTVNQVAPEFRESPTAGQSPPKGQFPENIEGPPTSPVGADHAMRLAVVWGIDGQYVRPLPVLAGLSNITDTEVTGEGLSEEIEIVIGVQNTPIVQTEVSNPFTPKMPKPPGGGRPGGGGPPPPPG